MNIASIYPCPYDIQDRHDPSAAVICGNSIYAYEEDKLTSIKSEATVKFPERSLMMGLKHFDLLPNEMRSLGVANSKIKAIDGSNETIF